MVDLEKPLDAALGKAEMSWVESRCMCTICPAYPKEDKGVKKAYCLRGDSAHKAQIEPSDCFCESCEVYKHGRLYGSNFFCLEGAALKEGLRNLLQGKPISKLAAEQAGDAPHMLVTIGGDVHRRGERPE